MKKIARINVGVDPEKEIEADIMEKAIIELASSMRALLTTRLKKEAIITLIHAWSKVNKRDVELVLNNLVQFEEIWLKPIKK